MTSAEPEAMSFSLSEGNELSHALLAYIGRVNGIRLLSIKGIVADHFQLRPPRVAADADVLVDPALFEEFCALLRERGWHERVEREVPSILGQHSVTLINDSWPNDIDAHKFYPGFFADPGVVFDRLWESSETLEIAHQQVRAPSRAGAAVISALHALRFTRSVRHHREAEEIKGVVRAFSSQAQAEFMDIARVGRALSVLRDIFAEIDIDVDDDLSASERRRWLVHRETTEDGAAASWLAAARNAPLRAKPGLLLRAVWITREDIPRNDPDHLPSRREAWQHRVLRWRRGGAALWHYFRVVLRIPK